MQSHLPVGRDIATMIHVLNGKAKSSGPLRHPSAIHSDSGGFSTRRSLLERLVNVHHSFPPPPFFGSHKPAHHNPSGSCWVTPHHAWLTKTSSEEQTNNHFTSATETLYLLLGNHSKVLVQIYTCKFVTGSFRCVPVGFFVLPLGDLLSRSKRSFRAPLPH